MQELKALGKQLQKFTDRQGILEDALFSQVRKGQGDSDYAKQLRTDIASLEAQSRTVLAQIKQCEKELNLLV